MWIESHQNLGQHPKTKRLARLLNTDLRDVVGLLMYLWWWAMDYAQDGDLSKYSDADIADGVMWNADPAALMDALAVARFVDRDEDGVRIHDWFDYAGKMLGNREKNRERAKKSYNARKQAVVLGQNILPNLDNIDSAHSLRADCGATVPTVPDLHTTKQAGTTEITNNDIGYREGEDARACAREGAGAPPPPLRLGPGNEGDGKSPVNPAAIPDQGAVEQDVPREVYAQSTRNLRVVYAQSTRRLRADYPQTTRRLHDEYAQTAGSLPAGFKQTAKNLRLQSAEREPAKPASASLSAARRPVGPAAETPAGRITKSNAKKAKQKYGSYGWVKLTKKEYDDLKTEHGAETLINYIGIVDKKAQQTGNKNGWKDWDLIMRKAIEEKWTTNYAMNEAQKPGNRYGSGDPDRYPAELLESFVTNEFGFSEA